MHRRLQQTLSIVLLLPLALAVSSRAAPPAERPLPAKLDESIDRGLAYLARRQRADGSFDEEGDGPKYKLAETGLGLLAMLACGHIPDEGRYGITARSALDFLVASVPGDGYVGKVDDSRMYGQGIVALALAEAYGVEPVAEKRRGEYAALRRMVEVILKAQAVNKSDAFAGGWRYTPDAADSDLSLSGWNVLALRAAQDVGVPVPREAIARGSAFVARCYNRDQKGFAYQPGNAAQSGPTGTGVLCLYLLDRAERPEVKDATKFLAEHPADDAGQYPYYVLYYTTQAAWQAGDDVWSAVSKVTLQRLIKTQSPDGAWPKDPAAGEPGRVYRTAMGVLTLSVPYRLLPIYQR